MSVSFINHFQKLQKLIHQSEGLEENNLKQKSVLLIGKLIQSEIQQKKELGIYPRRRVIDQKFKEKVKHNSDINCINSSIISKNYQQVMFIIQILIFSKLEGIELLIEELFRRPLIITEQNISMVTFDGVRTPVTFSKKAQVVKLLLDLQKINELSHIKNPRIKGEIIRLPITLKHVNELISRRNVIEGNHLSMNHNFVDLFQNPNKQEQNIDFSLNQGKIHFQLKLVGQKRPLNNGQEVNFFNLSKGPLLQNTDRVDINSTNAIVETKNLGYSNFIQSFLQDQFTDQNQSDVFGTNLNDGDFSMDDLFSFANQSGQMQQENGGNSNFNTNPQKEITLMNAFQYQGERFKEDPFSYMPEIPETYKPFEFGCMADRRTINNEPMLDQDKKARSDIFSTMAMTEFNQKSSFSGVQQTKLGSNIFNFTETQLKDNNLFQTEEQNMQKGATPQTRTSSIYQMLAEEYSHEESTNKLSGSMVEGPKYWEDLDATQDTFLIYSTKKKTDQKYEPVNIISTARNDTICQKVEQSLENIFELENKLVDDKFIRKHLDLLLMGIPNELFIVEEESNSIKLCNFDKALDTLSKKGLNSFLQEFEQPATQIFKLYTLAHNLRSSPLENSFTNKTLHTILDEYLNYINQVVLDIPQHDTLLEYQHELQELFTELDLIFNIFYRPTLMLTSTSSHMELEAIKNTKTAPREHLNQTDKKSIDTDNLDMLHHLLCSLQRSSPNVALVNYIFKQCMVPILSTLRLICFKGHHFKELENKLGIKTEKDADYNFTFKNVPEILNKCMNDVMYCAQNISMLQSSDEELFKILMGKYNNEGDMEEEGSDHATDDMNGVLELIVSPENVQTYQNRVNQRFKRIEKRVREVFLKRKMKTDERKLELLKEKLTKLKKMKLQVEMQKETKYRMRELERFKKTQLNNILQVQAIESQARRALKRQMELEFEKSLLMDNELRIKQAERDKIIQEIRDLGSGFDQEIELMIQDLETRRHKQREVMEQQQLEEQAKQEKLEQERREKLKEKGSLGQILSDNEEQDGSKKKNKQKQIMLIDDGQGFGVNVEELKQDTENMKHQVNNLIQNSYVHSNNQTVVKEGAMEEEHPPKPDQLDIQKMIQNPFKVKLEEDQENEEVRKNLFMEAKTSNLISLQTLAPPLTVMFHATVTQNIKAQAELTNRLILKILFEKYDVMSILNHFKLIFLGERGDCTEALIDLIYGEGVTFGQGEIKSTGLMGLTEFFNSWKFKKNEETDWDMSFNFKLKKRINVEDLQNNGIISSNVYDLVTATCSLPPLVSFLMSDQVVQLYFRIMCFACKFRLHSRVLTNLWKHIHIDIQDPQLKVPKQICRNLMFIRHSAQNFSNKFLDYFYHMIIESGWAKMTSQFLEAKTFNNLFKFQARFLSFVSNWGFISAQNATNKNLAEWMQLIVKLNTICRRLTIGYEMDTDFKVLNDQVKELAAKLTMIHQSFENIIDTQITRIKYKVNSK